MTIKKVVVITDNAKIYTAFKTRVLPFVKNIATFTFYCSPGNTQQFNNEIDEITIQKDYTLFVDNCHMVLSLHCQQVFPPELIDRVKCVNVHPGLNPHNRGWYPHIFGIMNGKPTGATIHEIDYKIDHGPVIVAQQVEVLSWDTSETLYQRIIEAELQMLENHIVSIIENTYKPLLIIENGNYNSKNDFKNLCQIDMNEVGTFEQFYNKMRALSFTGYNNAWFIDKEGNKVFLNLKVEKMI